MDKLFLHVCCAPCLVYPWEFLREKHPGLRVDLWFYNPNIHGAAEFKCRRDGLAFWAMTAGSLDNGGPPTVDFSPPYEPQKFMDYIGAENKAPARCRLCYRLRLSVAAQEAAARGHRFFGTTLAYSRRQNQDMILEEGRAAASAAGLEFYYEDWRPGWQRGHELAKQQGLYRQNYCGCAFSEWEK